MRTQAGILAVGAWLVVDASAASPPFRVAPPSAWVVPTEAPPSEAGSTRDAAGGLHYELLDFQLNLATNPPQDFFHVRMRVLNQEGLPEASQFSLDFDPSYQSLTFHSARIHRGSRVIDALNRERVQMLRRESELEYQMLDGRLTALLNLEDVRVGDLVEYAYTLEGVNPARAKHPVGFVSLGPPRAVTRLETRVRWPADRPVVVRQHRTAVEPRIEHDVGQVIYVWSLRDLPARRDPIDLPFGYDPRPFVQLSSFQNWGEVSRWGEALFRLPPQVAPAVRTIADSILRRWKDPESRALEALRFVQDDVRYFAVIPGEGAFRPHPPALVMRRRFGDCKDKVALLLDLLRALEIHADPVLVSTMHGSELDLLAPDPTFFDHVIARIVLAGHSHFVDPTRRGQRGSRLVHRSAPGDGWGLVLAPDTDRIIHLEAPRESRPKTHIEKHFAASRYDAPARLTVTSTFAGSVADFIRLQFQAQSLEATGEDYLRFYQKLYPKARALEPVVVTDTEDSNLVRVVETYEIPDFWVPDSTTGRFAGNVSPLEIQAHIPPTATPDRTEPLGLAGPNRVTCNTQVDMAEEWGANPGNRTIDTRFARVHLQEHGIGSRLHLLHEIETRAWMVPATDLGEYSRALEPAEEMFDFIALSGAGKAGRPANGGLHWPLVFLSLATLTVVTWLARRTYRLPVPAWWGKLESYVREENPSRETAGDIAVPISDLESPVVAPTVEAAKPAAIGGPLILLAVGVWVAPIRVLIESSWMASTLDRSGWAAMLATGETNRTLLEVILIFEVCANILLFVFAILAAVAFMRRRRTFPLIFSLLVISGVTIKIVDLVLAPRVGAGPATPSEVRQVLTQVVVGILWAFYLLRSRRARETFIR